MALTHEIERYNEEFGKGRVCEGRTNLKDLTKLLVQSTKVKKHMTHDTKANLCFTNICADIADCFT